MSSVITTAALSAGLDTPSVRVRRSGVTSVNTDFKWTSASTIPPGFARVCQENHWGVESTWDMLNEGQPWLRGSNDAYIYLNNADGQWWIDKPDGSGVFVAPKNPSEHKPPETGWKALSPSYDPLPYLEFISVDSK